MENEKQVSIVSCPHILSDKKEVYFVKPGSTIADVIKGRFKNKHDLRITVNGEVCLEQDWEFVKVKTNDCVTVRSVMRGGNGLRIVLTLIVMVVAVIVGNAYGAALASSLGGSISAATAGGLITGAVMIAGTLAINMLCPPVVPKQEVGSSRKDDTIYSLSAGSNQLGNYEPFSQVLGTMRIFPRYAALPYTALRGDDQYLYLCFSLGYGPLAVSDLKLKDTAISNIKNKVNSNYNNISYFIYQNAAIANTRFFKRDVYEESVSVELVKNGAAAGVESIRTTRADTDEFHVEIAFPNGIGYMDKKGHFNKSTVDFQIRYRNVTDPENPGAWKTASDTVSTEAYSVALSAPEARHSTSIRTGSGQTPGKIYGLVLVDNITGVVSIETSSGESNWYESRYPATPTGKLNPKTFLITSTYTEAQETDGVVTYVDHPVSFEYSDVTDVTSTGFVCSWNGSTFSVTAGTITGINLKTTANRFSTIRKALRITPPTSGTYEVGIKRTTANDTRTNSATACYWTVLRSISNINKIVSEPNIVLLEMRIKATDQLNGAVTDFNCVVSNMMKSYCPSNPRYPNVRTWKNNQISSNPADLFRYVLQGYANKRPRTDAQIDLTTLESWAISCDRKGYAYAYNKVLFQRQSIIDVLREIAAAGCASLTTVDGKYSIIEDVAKPNIVQHFTPRNSFNFSSTKIFINIPHAFRIKFANEDKNYNDDEIIVYNDGYSIDGAGDTEVATLIEDVPLIGITNAKLCQLHARYHLATLSLRPETYSFETDFEYLVCTKGDRIKYTNDITLHGISACRITGYTDDTTNLLTLSVDTDLILVTGTSYNFRIRNSTTGDSTIILVTTADRDEKIRTVSVNGAYSLETYTPDIGDLVLFGVAGLESVDLIIKSIQPSNGLNAKIEALDYSASLFSLNAQGYPVLLNDIPDFQSKITAWEDFNTLVIPEVAYIKSGQDQAIITPRGGVSYRITIKLVKCPYPFFVNAIMVQHKLSGTDNWSTQERFDADSLILHIDNVFTEELYDIRIRYKVNNISYHDNWLEINDYKVVGKNQPPPMPTNVRTISGYGSVTLLWDNPDEFDFVGVKIWKTTTKNLLPATYLKEKPSAKGRSDTFTDKEVIDGQIYYYWLASYDDSGHYSGEKQVMGKSLDQSLDPTNLVRNGNFDRSKSTAGWGNGRIVNVTGKNEFSKALRITSPGAVEGPYRAITAGIALYFAGWVNTKHLKTTTGTAGYAYFGVQIKLANGTIKRLVDAGSNTRVGCKVPVGSTWTYVSGYVKLPTTAKFISPAVIVPNYLTGFVDVADLCMSKHQLGATIGAPPGTTVGGTDSVAISEDYSDVLYSFSAEAEVANVHQRNTILTELNRVKNLSDSSQLLPLYAVNISSLVINNTSWFQCLTPDGDLFLTTTPETGSEAYLYDHLTKTTEALYNSTVDYRLGCLSPNGNIYMFTTSPPAYSKRYNTYSKIATAIGLLALTTFQPYRVILLPNNKIFIYGYESVSDSVGFILYNCSDDTQSSFVTFGNASTFGEPILLPNGKVLLHDSGISSVWLYDFSTDSVTTMLTDLTLSTTSHNALLPSGEIYFAPTDGTSQAEILNTTTGVIRLASGDYSVFGAEIVRCLLIPDGRVLLYDTNSGETKIYNPDLDTFGDTQIGDITAYQSFHIMLDGTILMIPDMSSVTQIKKIITKGKLQPSWGNTYKLGPFINKNSSSI